MFFLIHQPASQGLCPTRVLSRGCLNDISPPVVWQLLGYIALSPTTVQVPLGWDLDSGQYV